MNPDFHGRKRELASFERVFSRVSDGGSRPGQCLIIRGRRRVGKSRLIEEFVNTLDVPSLFFTASNISASQELAHFTQAINNSDLPDADQFSTQKSDSWDTALRLLAQILPSDQPSVVVLDELPYLTEHVEGIEGTLQTIWDRIMSRKPVLLFLVGSDLSIMKAINTYERPFYQRGNPMLIEPLTVSDVQEMTELPAAEAIDAHLITGGMPRLSSLWRQGEKVENYLNRMLSNLESPFVTAGELAIAAEFPPDTYAPQILSAVASGERTFTSILQDTDLTRTTLSRALVKLTEKGIIAAEFPLSAKPSKETRYRITDSYLRFWLHFVQPLFGEIGRGRTDRVMKRIMNGWFAWRGRAVEPLVRESLARLLPEDDTTWLDLDHSGAVGGYWTRTNDVEIDIVGADREPVAKRIGFLGSIKWHENAPLSRREFGELAMVAGRVAGVDADTPLIGVSRIPSDSTGWTAVFDSEDIVRAWLPR